MGSHTADALTQRGASVSILDKVKSPWLNGNQKMIVADAMNFDILNEVPEENFLSMKDVYYYIYNHLI